MAIYRTIGIGGVEKERIAQEEKRIRLISNFRDVNPLTNYWSSLREGYKLEAHLISRLFHLSAKERTCTRAYVHECVRAYHEFAVPCLNLQCPFTTVRSPDTRFIRRPNDCESTFLFGHLHQIRVSLLASVKKKEKCVSWSCNKNSIPVKRSCELCRMCLCEIDRDRSPSVKLVEKRRYVM